MTLSSPLLPKVRNGTIAAYAFPSLLPQVLIFQYNPEGVGRQLSSRGSEGGGGRGDAQRVNGPPAETISLSVKIDATDQLQLPNQNAIATENVLHPVIAAMEGLMAPAYAAVIANQAMALAGSAFILGEQAPLAFLIWGERRVEPVQLVAVNFREEAFDTSSARLFDIEARKFKRTGSSTTYSAIVKHYPPDDDVQLPFGEPLLAQGGAGQPLGSWTSAPPGGASFGETRAGPVDAVVAGGPWPDFAAFRRAVYERMRGAGIDPDNPHLDQ